MSAELASRPLIVLDTTVLVYAQGADHPLRGSCREVIAAVADGAIRAATTVEVIQEFAHVRGRRRGRQDAARLAESYALLLAPLLTPGLDDLLTGLSLFREHDRLGAFDAVLVACARSAGATTVVSSDRAFGLVSSLDHCFPDADGVKSLLAA